MPSITTGFSTPAGTSPVMRSQAQSKTLPHLVPGAMGRKSWWSSSPNGTGSGDREISARSGATFV